MPRLIALVLLAICAAAGEPVLQKGDRLAICGDSITEQKQYSRFIAIYLAACQPQLEVDVAQFGWGGEVAGGFANRLARSVAWFKPTVATTCYGMNDGGYKAYAEGTGKTYVENHQRILAGFKEQGARVVVVGSPGVVDSTTYKRADPAIYNATLAQLRDRAREVATAANMPFADVHQPMFDAMAKAKEAYGAGYHVGGGDGVHPGPNGHVIMAYAFLKALAVDGNLARIELSMAGKATASAGHTVDKAAAGTATITSTRYPYLLAPGKRPEDAGSIAQFVPFQDELSRFILVVPDCTWPQAKVTWGEASAVFTKEQLAAGVNLAAIAKGPFDAAFATVDKAAADLQGLETFLVKSVLAMNIPGQLKDDAGFKAAVDGMAQSVVAKRAELAKGLRAAVVPVTWTVTVSQP